MLRENGLKSLVDERRLARAADTCYNNQLAKREFGIYMLEVIARTAFENKAMEQEDADLFVEIDSWFAEHLPWPPQCKRQEPVVCWFKTENSKEMLKMIVPALWLLDRYEVPYYLVYSNTPGEIVYEDQYQIAAMAGEALQIEELQPSWSPED